MKKLTQSELKRFLDEKVSQFNRPDFITDDPISIPHQFHRKEDIEISAFITALIAWGQRPVILRNAQGFMERMDFRPYEFILHHTPGDRKTFRHFVHRTFNGTDAVYLIKALYNIYRNGQGLEGIFADAHTESNDMSVAISTARKKLLSFAAPARTYKHFADPLRNSSAKRLCMYLRWMVRRDKKGVDFGIWKSISPAVLYCPLDIHSGRVARSLGLLNRNQNDWKAVDELTQNLRKLDPTDPVQYDFALFGLGAIEGFR